MILGDPSQRDRGSYHPDHLYRVRPSLTGYWRSVETGEWRDLCLNRTQRGVPSGGGWTSRSTREVRGTELSGGFPGSPGVWDRSLKTPTVGTFPLPHLGYPTLSMYLVCLPFPYTRGLTFDVSLHLTYLV